MGTGGLMGRSILCDLAAPMVVYACLCIYVFPYIIVLVPVSLQTKCSSFTSLHVTCIKQLHYTL